MLPLLVPVLLLAAAPPAADLPTRLRQLAATWPATRSAAVAAELRERLHEAGRRETRLWQGLTGRADWERYRDERLARLRASLGGMPVPPGDLKLRVRRTLEGDGYRIDCLTFKSRPGLVVTANLYRPATPGTAMPGILICHSHHNPKTEGELQDMGALWARAGCYVLIPDLLGHGERRQHPFRGAADFPAPFRAGRQDYYFRYNLAIGLQTAGDSLMGWLCHDLMRCLDLLLSRPGIDSKKIVLLGAVAGGGDPAAVTAALDPRVTASAVFNFGGPQPETRYPLADDAETSFLYSGSGSWESTRNLARSAADGFLPWVIVASLAPRRHVHAHEFSWDEARDPVWRRLRQVHRWYGSPDHLAAAHGTGLLSGRPPAASHCNNIGPVQRRGLHDAFRRWFGIVVEERPDRDRRPAADLLCLDREDRLTPVHVLAGRLAAERASRARDQRARLAPGPRRDALRQAWQRLLGDVRPGRPDWVVQASGPPPGSDVEARWVGLPGESWVWALVLTRRDDAARPRPAVVAFGQGGPALFLRHRAATIARHLAAGRAVVLADLGGHSAVPPGSDRGRTSGSTAAASSLLMLGRPALGERLRELRTLLAYLREQPTYAADRLTLWGDSFAPINPPERRVEVPLDVPQPALAEPLGGVLALLAGLFEDGLQGIEAYGGLAGYADLLASPFVHVPYDVVVPGALTTGDLPDVVAALAPLPLRLDGLVDGHNRLLAATEAERRHAAARSAYRAAGAAERLQLASRPPISPR